VLAEYHACGILQFCNTQHFTQSHRDCSCDSVWHCLVQPGAATHDARKGTRDASESTAPMGGSPGVSSSASVLLLAGWLLASLSVGWPALSVEDNSPARRRLSSRPASASGALGACESLHSGRLLSGCRHGARGSCICLLGSGHSCRALTAAALAAVAAQMPSTAALAAATNAARAHT
jgi:hypothetical protein